MSFGRKLQVIWELRTIKISDFSIKEKTWIYYIVSTSLFDGILTFDYQFQYDATISVYY